MALLSLQNAMILLGGTDISDHTSQVELDLAGDNLDATTFSTAGWKAALGGLKSGTLKVTIKGDFAVGNIDSLLWGYFNTVQTFEIRAVNTARSTSNPAYTGSVLVNSLNPITGSVGDLVDFDLSWPTSGTILRQTS